MSFYLDVGPTTACAIGNPWATRSIAPAPGKRLLDIVVRISIETLISYPGETDLQIGTIGPHCPNVNQMEREDIVEMKYGQKKRN
ncbi:hypothetical protein ACLOJK_009659 [Asimina triloba]